MYYVVSISNVALGIFDTMDEAKKAVHLSGKANIEVETPYYCDGILTTSKLHTGRVNIYFTIVAVKKSTGAHSLFKE